MIAVWLLTLGLVDLGPHPASTPGLTRPLSLTEVCTTRWGTDRRKVTIGMKRRVAAAYGVRWADRAQYEFDHLVPRSLAGADDELNLWPQTWRTARAKDRLEVQLSKDVCAGRMELAAAQYQIRTDWLALYRRVFGETPPVR